ncbi:class I SAM-dependent methyltransferase [Streptomyces sp. NPDC020883]|uniref:class I SAM-dependent methyltransferase n=1 Tax=Streptomyces sp. NPDC020883 TaxID=3365099 RepID=UPI00378CA292
MANSYSALSQYYDLIVTSGYYDYGAYDAYARTLLAQLGDRREVLEIGVGSGLVCERLLELSGAALRITGIDHAESTIAQARARLGHRVQLVRHDIAELTGLPAFDAAYSVAGVWYEAEDATGTALCSHLLEESDDIRALRNLAAAVRPGGPLLLAVHQGHRTYQRPLPGGLVYAQEVRTEGRTKGYMTGDRYVQDCFVRRAGEVVAHQRRSFRVYPQDRADQLLAECGFRFDAATGDGLLRQYLRT